MLRKAILAVVFIDPLTLIQLDGVGCYYVGERAKVCSPSLEMTGLTSSLLERKDNIFFFSHRLPRPQELR